MNKNWLSQTALSSVLAIALVNLSSCSVNPATGSADVVFSSESAELKQGREAHEKIINSMPMYQDEKLNNYVRAIGEKLAAVSDRPGLDYQFFIVDSPDVNAFALPGGYIYINRGLIAFLENEAQLAAILAHEIAHVTARHAIRQESARTGAKTLSILSAILTGSGEVGQAANLYTTAAVRGYGRDMELEADGFGAKYLQAAGYPAKAMYEVIAILKDHQVYQRRQAKASGRKAVAYHGVFSSHPRNDKRLQKLINTVDQTGGEKRSVAFRQAIDGMIIGNNQQATVGNLSPSAANNSAPKEQRFRHNSLGFSFAYPEGWSIEQSSKAIQVKDDKGQLQLNIGVHKYSADNIESWLRDHYQVSLLRQSEPLYQAGLTGHSGILSKPQMGQQRVAAFARGRLAYTLNSPWQAPTLSQTQDAAAMSIISSFRPERRQLANKKNRRLHFVKANARTRFADLARQARLGRNGADFLRIINGYYPAGEPRPGEIIKIIQ